MKYSKKVCIHDKVTVALNADKDRYYKTETNTNGYHIGNVCVCCHDSEGLNSFRAPTKSNGHSAVYARVTFLEMIVLKENASQKDLVDYEGHFLITVAGNTLIVDRPYHHLYGSTIQRIVKAKGAYRSINIISHILSKCKTAIYLNNVIIDYETTSKIKKALNDNITKEYKDELLKNKASANVTTNHYGFTNKYSP